MVTTLYLIRHGQTEGTEGGTEMRYKGSLDVLLSPKGIEQVKKTSLLLRDTLKDAGRRLKAVYTSDLSRALRSAEIIAKDNLIEPIPLPELRERNFGAWEGMSFDEIRKAYPDAFSLWAKDPLRFSPVGGESTLEVKERVMKVLDVILEKHNGDVISLVSHGGVNRVILCYFLGVPLENIFRIEQDYACLNIIEVHDAYPVLKAINMVRR